MLNAYCTCFTLGGLPSAGDVCTTLCSNTGSLAPSRADDRLRGPTRPCLSLRGLVVSLANGLRPAWNTPSAQPHWATLSCIGPVVSFTRPPLGATGTSWPSVNCHAIEHSFCLPACSCSHHRLACLCADLPVSMALAAKCMSGPRRYGFGCV